MTARNTQSNGAAGRPTSISVRQVRAGILHDALLSDPAAVVVTEDIPRLARFSRWAPAVLAAALDDLIDAGLVEEDAYGRLCIHAEPTT